jgi:3-dehydroquinate synthase class II
MRKIVALIAAAVLLPLLAAQAKDKPAPVSKTFKVEASTKIHVGDNKTATLADIKAGDKVGIAYHDDNGTLVADHIKVEGEKKHEKKAEGEHKKHEPKPGELRAHGVVTAVDATAGTVTVDVHEGHHKK